MSMDAACRWYAMADSIQDDILDGQGAICETSDGKVSYIPQELVGHVLVEEVE